MCSMHLNPLNVQVFHAPGQSPYSVLVEQRGVEELLLLESQV